MLIAKNTLTLMGAFMFLAFVFLIVGVYFIFTQVNVVNAPTGDQGPEGPPGVPGNLTLDGGNATLIAEQLTLTETLYFGNTSNITYDEDSDCLRISGPNVCISGNLTVDGIFLGPGDGNQTGNGTCCNGTLTLPLDLGPGVAILSESTTGTLAIDTTSGALDLDSLDEVLGDWDAPDCPSFSGGLGLDAAPSHLKPWGPRGTGSCVPRISPSKLPSAAPWCLIWISASRTWQAAGPRSVPLEVALKLMRMRCV